MKAIETRYNGYRFRSRLEARWAVFFDSLGIKYQYEPEGYVTDAGPYLPDFFLPEKNYIIEIKPSPATEDEKAKLGSLARGTGIDCFLIQGDVWPESHDIVHVFPYGFNEEDRIIFASHYQWTECPACRKISIASHGLAADLGCLCLTDFALVMDLTTGEKTHGALCLEISPRLMEAFIAAREARFEHGEKPGRPKEIR